MVAWFSIAPDDGSGSYSKQVAAAIEMVQASGLEYRLGSMGTEIEGPRDEVLALLLRCHSTLASAPGVRRTSTVIKIDDRAGVDSGELERKRAAVERLM
jgi:uncharacterized protein (TIGR00106 family)